MKTLDYEKSLSIEQRLDEHNETAHVYHCFLSDAEVAEAIKQEAGRNDNVNFYLDSNMFEAIHLLLKIKRLCKHGDKLTEVFQMVYEDLEELSVWLEKIYMPYIHKQQVMHLYDRACECYWEHVQEKTLISIIDSIYIFLCEPDNADDTLFTSVEETGDRTQKCIPSMVEDSYKKSTYEGDSYKKQSGFARSLKVERCYDGDTAYEVAVAYMDGKGDIIENTVEGYRWLKKAAELGNYDAIRKLADMYFYGTYPCTQDYGKAKSMLLRAIAQEAEFPDFITAENRYSGWEKEWNCEFSILRHADRDTIISLANIGVVDAQYWLAERLYQGDTIFEQDRALARRWFLKAAIFDHYPAVQSLSRYYAIDATKRAQPSEMFDEGFSCSGTDEQSKDLKFYWYSKAVENGYTDALNNLAVCYNDGVGTQADTKKANELFKKALLNGNSAGYRNLGYNMYYGIGCEKDIAKARQYMLEANKRGNQSAAEFLEEYFDIPQQKTFYGFFPIRLTEGDVICSLKQIQKVNGGALVLTFEVNNYLNKSIKLSINNFTVNRLHRGNKYIGEWKSFEENDKSININDAGLYDVSAIEFIMEISDEFGNILINSAPVNIVADPIGGMAAALLNGDIRLIKGRDYSFAYENFEDITIFNEMGLRLDFCGVDVNEYGEASLSFFAENESDENYCLWAKKLVIDEQESDKQYIKMDYICSDDSGYYSLQLPYLEISEAYHNIEVSIEIDEGEEPLNVSKRVHIFLCFDDEEMYVVLEDDEDAWLYEPFS